MQIDMTKLEIIQHYDEAFNLDYLFLRAPDANSVDTAYLYAYTKDGLYYGDYYTPDY